MLSDSTPCLLPQPKSVKLLDGTFEIDAYASIVLGAGTSSADILTAQRLKNGLLTTTGYELPVVRLDIVPGAHRLILRVVPNADAESYSLRISGDCVIVEGASSAGLHYGIETLLQIAGQYGIDLPALEITDTPDFAVRGLYHDITRGQVPTLATMKQLADLCVAYKMNHLEFYVEHSFLFESMREIGAGMDPITAEEILELDRYCRERHIDLVPSISTFGHLYEVLRTRAFHHLNELPVDGGDKAYSWVDRMMHYTLDVNNPGSIELIKRMFDEYLPLFSSEYVNICCDETFDLGKGKNSDTAPKDLYIKHLMAVIDLVKARGKRVLFWGDMVLEYSELLDKLPKDAVVLNWHYGATPPEEPAAKFEKTGLTQYVCPGTQVWSSFTGKVHYAESNIRHMATYGKKYHATGILNTNWGDLGHMNLLSASIQGMVLGASYGWNVDGTPEQGDFDTSFSRTVYGDKSGRLGALLRRLGEVDPYRFWIAEDRTFAELAEVGRKTFSMTGESLRKDLTAATEILRELAQLRVSAHPDVRKDYDEFIWSASMIAAANRLALLMFGEDIGDKELLANELERLYDEYAKLWRRRSKESELFRIREAFLRTVRRVRES